MTALIPTDAEDPGLLLEALRRAFDGFGRGSIPTVPANGCLRASLPGSSEAASFHDSGPTRSRKRRRFLR